MSLESGTAAGWHSDTPSTDGRMSVMVLEWLYIHCRKSALVLGSKLYVVSASFPASSVKRVNRYNFTNRTSCFICGLWCASLSFKTPWMWFFFFPPLKKSYHFNLLPDYIWRWGVVDWSIDLAWKWGGGGGWSSATTKLGALSRWFYQYSVQLELLIYRLYGGYNPIVAFSTKAGG